ncbi:TolC family protein [Methylomarinum vadi]|uniref:TolC family protein n=1 Tax=Methylomarinum vadi TaxID=438855 RepID=UPI00056AA7C8|nr:TolC family protein [Methylomarinum vadi]
MHTLRKTLTFLGAAFWLNSGVLNAESFTLPQAVDYALQNNPDLQIMQERIGQAEAQLGEALAAFYPQIKTGLYYEHSDNPSRAFAMVISQRRLDFSIGDQGFNHPGGVDNYRPEVSASYSLFRGGQDYQRSKAAELGVEAAALNRSALRNRLIQAVHSAYYGYLAAVEAHKVTQRSITAVTSELKQSRTRYEAGTALKSDVLSLEVQLAQAQDDEIQAANAIELARTGLKTLLGLNAEKSLEIESGADWALPEADNGFAELLSQAMAQRPEILAANKQLAIAQRQLSAAQGTHLPRADAYVSYGSDSKNLDFSTNRDNVTAGVKVEMDIFSGFATQEKINEARHQLTAAEKTVTRTRLNIEKEVKSAHLKLQEALARLKVTTASVAAAEEALRMVNEQRNAGVVTVTRYIEAEVARDRALSRRIAARFDALIADAQLNQAIGRWR